MKTQVEHLSPVKKKLNVEVEPKEVDRRLDDAYRRLSHQAKIPGFRPGKAPRRLLEVRYGAQVTQDVAKEIIQETLDVALQELETPPVSPPLVEMELLRPGTRFAYEALVEVLPPFELGPYKGLEVEKPQGVVTEERIDKELEAIRQSHGTLTSVDEPREVREGDYVILEYTALHEGRPIQGMSAPNLLMKAGGHEFHPAFDEAVLGLKKGEGASFSVDFEDDFRHEAFAGKHVDFEVRVVELKEMKLPALDDTFAQSLGSQFETLEDLRKEIRQILQKQEEERVDAHMKGQLMEKISKTVDFEIPPSLVEAEIESAVDRLKRQLERNGSSLEKAGLSLDKLREQFLPAAQQRAKNQIILAEIAKREEITLDGEDLARGLYSLAQSTGQPIETIMEAYQRTPMMNELKAMLLRDKTLNYLLEHATIKEQNPSLNGGEET